jgi:hypothetical protein
MSHTNLPVAAPLNSRSAAGCESADDQRDEEARHQRNEFV